MLIADISLTQIGLFLIYISLPIIALYFVYLLIKNAFKYMGFSAYEAVAIIFGCFILGYGFLDKITGIPFYSIPLFSYNNWIVGINTGGAIIPIIISIYLSYKNKLSWKHLLIGIIIVTIITYLVTYPDPGKGIVSPWPLWLLPAVGASMTSIFLLWKKFRKAAPLAYISGTIGVLIGADVFHLIELLNHSVEESVNATIGGAVVLDMVFITGILAVILDGIFLYKQRTREGFD
jgi:uncharacterized membrane protein